MSSLSPISGLVPVSVLSTSERRASVSSTHFVTMPSDSTLRTSSAAAVAIEAVVSQGSEAPNAEPVAQSLFARVCSNISDFLTAIVNKIASFFGNRNVQAVEATRSPLELAQEHAAHTASLADRAVAHRDVQRAEETQAIQVAVNAAESVDAAIIEADAAVLAADEAVEALAPLLLQHEEELAQAESVALARSLEAEDAAQAAVEAAAGATFEARLEAATAEYAATIASK
ncbi:MAG: hypothetical protein NTX49_00570 [Chlamydiae bacterium]|nr:hypothetical protein [Chlamydiota bacterium]